MEDVKKSLKQRSGLEISDSKGNCEMKNANENCKLARVSRLITPVCAFSMRGLPFRNAWRGFLQEALEISDFKEDPKRVRGGMAQKLEFIHSC